MALVLGLATRADALPRYSRPEVQVPVQLSNRVKPVIPKRGPAQPAVTTDAALSITSLVRPARKEQEHVLQQLIQHTPDSEVEEKSDYWFRLGELYASQHRHWRIAGDVNKARDYLLKAVRAFKALTNNDAFRNYSKMDVALFYYGYTLQGGKYMREARMVFDALLKNYPSSNYVPEAHLAFGDYYFESGQLADAEARYKMVLKFPKSAVHTYATYKLGWVHFRLQRFQEALESFFLVSTQAKGKSEGKLARAGRIDFVRAYAEIGRAEKAHAAFQRVDRSTAFEMLEALAGFYAENGKADRATYVLRELMSIAPKDPRICAWQYHVAHSMLSAPGANTTDKVKAIEDLVALYRALSGRNQLPMREIQECKANAMAMSGELARAYHNESTKTRNNDTLGYAVRLYQTHVDAFANEPTSPDNRYYLAEALWSRAVTAQADKQGELFERAAHAFADVARSDRARAPVATYAAVLAWLNALDGTLPNPVPQLTRGRPAPARPLPQAHAHLVGAIAAYANAIGNAHDPELGHFRYIEAKLHRAADQHDKAAAIYVALVTTHPTADFAEGAAMLAIDSLVILQRLDEMLALADRLAANTSFMADKPELAKIIRLVRSRSMRR